MSKQVDWVKGFAVLRAPATLAGDVDLNNQVTVVSVWPDLRAVEAEVARLQALHSDPTADRYWWQSTHLHLGARKPE